MKKITDIRDSYIEEAAFIPTEDELYAALPNGFWRKTARFFNSAPGVAILCAIVSLGVLSAIVWAGQRNPIGPDPGGIVTETESELTQTEETEAETETNGETSSDIATESETESQSETVSETESETESVSDSETDVDGIETPYDDLPKIRYDRPLNILSISESLEDFVPRTEQQGDALSGALIARNAQLQKDYGVTVNVIDGGGTIISSLRNEQSARFDEFDIYVNQLYAFTGSALQNHVKDLNTLTTLNLQSKWWDQACRENLRIDNKNFMMTGDISPSALMYASCMVYNQDMMQALNKTDPYTLVQNGQWTMGALLTYVDGVTNESTGQYGLTCWEIDTAESLFYGCGETFVKYDSQTMSPTISFDAGKAKDIYNLMYSIIWDAKSNLTFFETNQSVPAEQAALDVFAQGKALFAVANLRKVDQYITGMIDDYGILPMPKFNTAQSTYLSFVNGSAPHVMVSKTETTPDFVGTMLEAMATYNYTHVTPHILETVSKDGAPTDQQAAHVLDSLLRHRVYDFAYWVDLPLRQVMYNELITNRRDSVASALAQAKSRSASSLNVLLRDWDKISDKE